jgi:small multidrug resistance family-3 protein
VSRTENRTGASYGVTIPEHMEGTTGEHAGTTGKGPGWRLGRGKGRAGRRVGLEMGRAVTVLRSLMLFTLAAVAEIGGAWLVWQGVREHRGVLWMAGGVLALGVYGFVATLQPDGHFGRILAAYGGVFVAGSLAWGVVADGFRPDRWDLIGAVLCLLGVAVIMYGGTADQPPGGGTPTPATAVGRIARVRQTAGRLARSRKCASGKMAA